MADVGRPWKLRNNMEVNSRNFLFFFCISQTWMKKPSNLETPIGTDKKSEQNPISLAILTFCRY